jgi:hypothetical protein
VFVDAYHVRSHDVPRERSGYEGDVGSVPGEGVSVRVSFFRYELVEVDVGSSGRPYRGGWWPLPS